jgi:hypothetical protein
MPAATSWTCSTRSSREACGALCAAWVGAGTQARCTGFTRFAAPQANGSNCFGNTDGAWMPLPVPGTLDDEYWGMGSEFVQKDFGQIAVIVTW